MPELENRNNLEHSREADEIFGRLPSWIIRWGITVIAGILAVLILACCLIKYPETVSSTIVLTSDNPPSDLRSRFSGILDSVYVKDGESVEAGQLIALIATPAVYTDVCIVEQLVDTLTMGSIRLIAERQGLRLGDLQSGWIELQRACSEYLSYKELDQADKKIDILHAQEKEATAYLDFLSERRSTVAEDYRLGQLSFRRDSSLFSEGLISTAEYEQSIMTLNAHKNALSDIDASIASARLNLVDLRRQISDISLQDTSDEQEYGRLLRHAERKMSAEIAAWKETYAFIAPFNGRVSLQNVWSRGQHVDVGDLVASVAGQDVTSVTGRLKVPSEGFGKVLPGQRVIVRLNGFPYMEYGVLQGVVRTISSVPEQSSGALTYTVTVSFPEGMVTTYHRELPFVQNMDGEAKIVTLDIRLIEQFIRPIRSLFVNN